MRTLPNHKGPQLTYISPLQGVMVEGGHICDRNKPEDKAVWEWLTGGKDIKETIGSDSDVDKTAISVGSSQLCFICQYEPWYRPWSSLLLNAMLVMCS